MAHTNYEKLIPKVIINLINNVEIPICSKGNQIKKKKKKKVGYMLMTTLKAYLKSLIKEKLVKLTTLVREQ